MVWQKYNPHFWNGSPNDSTSWCDIRACSVVAPSVGINHTICKTVPSPWGWSATIIRSTISSRLLRLRHIVLWWLCSVPHVILLLSHCSGLLVAISCLLPCGTMCLVQDKNVRSVLLVVSAHPSSTLPVVIRYSKIGACLPSTCLRQPLIHLLLPQWWF